MARESYLPEATSSDRTSPAEGQSIVPNSSTRVASGDDSRTSGFESSLPGSCASLVGVEPHALLRIS